MIRILTPFFALFGFFCSGVCAPALPNIVLIYSDDVGYGDVGVYGSELIPTPNLDRMAREGLVFTDAHSVASTCSPSRFSLLTGVHAFRHKVRILPPNAPLSISTDQLTLPKMLKKAGYHTAVVGKWHLGLGSREVETDWNGKVSPGPNEIGFDYSFLLPSTNDRVPCVYLENGYVVNLDHDDPLYVGKLPENAGSSTVYPDGRDNPEAMTYYKSTHGHNQSVINGIGRIGKMWGGQSALWDDETMADVFVEKAEKYIAERSRNRPFFLFFSSQDIHVPRAPHPRFQGSTKLGYRGDAMVQLDWSVGAILDTLEKHGFSENTIVMFSSDNGPVYDDGYDDGTTVKKSSEEVDNGHDGSGEFRGGKYQGYEGGTRVPLIIRWPASIEPGRSDALVSQIDFLASFAELVGVELSEGEGKDSISTLDAFVGRSKSGRRILVEEFQKRLALRDRHWKLLHLGKKTELYNLREDPSESRDLSQAHPDRVAEMQRKLRAIQESDKGMRLEEF